MKRFGEMKFMADFKVRKVFTQSGVSVAVVIPREYAEKLGLVDGSQVYFSLKDGFLVIQKVPEPSAYLDLEVDAKGPEVQ